MHRKNKNAEWITNLKAARKEVESWPKWKQNAMENHHQVKSFYQSLYEEFNSRVIKV